MDNRIKFIVYSIVVLILPLLFVEAMLQYAYTKPIDLKGCDFVYIDKYNNRCDVYKVENCKPPIENRVFGTYGLTRIYEDNSGVILLWSDDKSVFDVEKCNCRYLDIRKSTVYNDLVDLYCNIKYGWIGGLIS